VHSNLEFKKHRLVCNEQLSLLEIRNNASFRLFFLHWLHFSEPEVVAWVKLHFMSI